MSDPLERMAGFRSDVEGGPMLPADEVRRRGDRIRRRRRTAVAAGSALAVAAIAIPIALATTGGSPDRIDPAPPPTTPTQAEKASTLTEADLMTDGDTEYFPDDDSLDWYVANTHDDDSATVNPCQQAGFDELGASSVLMRDFVLAGPESEGGEADGDAYLNEVVGEFASPDAAQEAYQNIADWYADCQPEGAVDVDARPFEPASIGVDGDAQISLTTYGPPDADPGTQYDEGDREDFGWWMETGLVVSGNRVAMLTQLILGQDYNWLPEDGGTPVERMLPAAAERIVVERPRVPATTTSEAGNGDRATDIGQDFPIDRDLSAPEGDPISGPGANAIGINPLNICGDGRGGVGEAEWPREPVERLAASAPGPEYLDARELITLPDDADARGVLADIRSQIEDCSQNGDGQVWTIHDGPALGEEILVVSRTFDQGLGGDVYVFVRVGNAVLAVDQQGEWELSSTVPAGISEAADTAAAIVPDMCTFSVEGC